MREESKNVVFVVGEAQGLVASLKSIVLGALPAHYVFSESVGRPLINSVG